MRQIVTIPPEITSLDGYLFAKEPDRFPLGGRRLIARQSLVGLSEGRRSTDE